jgi:type VI secretion system secreted protein Hcp
MMVDGIKGQVTESKHKEWIDLQSCSFAVNRHIHMPVGAGTSRDAQLPSLSEIQGTKMFDKSSVELMKWTLGGAQGKNVLIHHVTVGGNDQSHTYLELKLTECLISSYSISSGGDKPMESLSLNFTKIEYRYIPQDEKGGVLAPVSAGWDAKTQKAA